MRTFHPATVVGKSAETEDSVRLTLSVASEVADEFRFVQGQHLPVRARIGERNVRRTYSICTSVADGTLELGIRVQPDGVFSQNVANELAIGDTLDVMPPFGRFFTQLDAASEKRYAAFVCGSGITPILSIVKTTLETEPRSRFVVFYGNRKRATTMFLEALWALKNLYRERLALHFIMSQEPGDIGLYTGRIDAEKAGRLHAAFLAHAPPDEVFLCGPNPMIDDLSAALIDLGYDPSNIHSERFRPGLRGEAPPPRRAEVVPAEGSEVIVLIDGHRQRFHMTDDDASILDAAGANGLELPYSCEAGVCSTCRTRLLRGEVDMAVNYALEPWEIERGFILACQARPKTDAIELDYDQA